MWAKSGENCPDPSSPYSVTSPTVAPAALHLSKSGDAALLPAEAAARPVDEVNSGLWVYCEVEEEAHHLPVSQNTGLGWTCGDDVKQGRQSSGYER